ncbi:hypothetical protein MLD38_027471 [Melastoma candidum]|uniref:Uncharacterized protein n=1 Tax=Melastoma candidum TaxID=119954 RepID=A0ACB9P2X9_9MYRT|nr:hypothetical protein MLD38_027471 [Melastoma candidum]
MEDYYYRMGSTGFLPCSPDYCDDDDEDDPVRAAGYHFRPTFEEERYAAAVDVPVPLPDSSDLTKARIATHPLYPQLVSAYIQCHKVGSPPEIASLLEEIGRHNSVAGNCSDLGADPELDEFMVSYCELLHRYKEELSKPFDEATSFLTNIESQLSNLRIDDEASTTMLQGSEEVAGSSDEELSGGEGEPTEHQPYQPGGANDESIKDVLLKKYSGYLSNLRKEFLKKRKNGKLPKDARTTLLDWWNSHYRWPYPTEEEKMKLSQATGLDPKQINNWFINQRKRHWKPSEDMRFALMEGVSGSIRTAPPPPPTTSTTYDHNVDGDFDSPY